MLQLPTRPCTSELATFEAEISSEILNSLHNNDPIIHVIASWEGDRQWLQKKNNEHPQKLLCLSKLLPVRIFVKREYLCEYKKIFVSKVGWAKQGIRKDAHTHCVETILEILGRFLVFPTIKFISFSILFFVKNFHTTVSQKQKIIQVQIKILRNKTLQTISTKPGLSMRIEKRKVYSMILQ